MIGDDSAATERAALFQTYLQVKEVVRKMKAQVPGPWVRELERALATAPSVSPHRVVE